MTSIRSRAAFVVSVLVFLLAAVPLVAFAASGDLDTSFDGDGKVTTDISTSGTSTDWGRAVAIQSDGKIVAAGECSGLSADFCLARYNSDGSLDTSFDTDGKVTTDIVGGFDQGRAVAIQSDGKIVAAGSCGSTSDFCLARYNSDGSLDTSFDIDGKLTTAFGTAFDIAYAVAIQSDGQIVAAGKCNTGSSYDFCLARYNSDGSLDTSFSGDGKVTTDIVGGLDEGRAVAIQSDGKIVAAGSCRLISDFCLARYNSDGSLDTTNFGGGTGKVTTDFATSSDLVWALAIQSDGQIVAAGQCVIGPAWNFCLARYSSDGSLDSTFGSGGKVTTDIGTGHDYAFAVAIQSDGKIVAAGQCNTGSIDFCLARYNSSDGSLDTGFGSSGTGKVTTAIGTGEDWGQAVAIQSDGKIVAAGYCFIGSWDFCLARYQGDVSNQPPVGVDDNYGVIQGNTLNVAAPGVLVNDTDPDPGTTLEAVLVANPTNGTLTLNADGSFTYTPDAGFSGADSFTYRASDGSLQSSVVTVTINVADADLASIIDAAPNLTNGQKSSLTKKLADAAFFEAAGKLGPACGKLDDFINQVNGLTPTKLDASTAAILVSGANALKASYGCP